MARRHVFHACWRPAILEQLPDFPTELSAPFWLDRVIELTDNGLPLASGRTVSGEAALASGAGRIEWHVLPYPYRHLSLLVT
jgi:hypothetical protein